MTEALLSDWPKPPSERPTRRVARLAHRGRPAVLAQWEREVVSERTKAALAHLKAQGRQLGRPRLRPDQEDRQAGARILELKGQGLTLRKIADTLIAEGFRT